MMPGNRFDWINANPLYPHQDSTATAGVPQQQPAIPPEFPGLIYDVLRSYPDAMEAVAKAAKEFYDKRVPR